MSIWASRLTAPAAGTGKDKLEPRHQQPLHGHGEAASLHSNHPFRRHWTSPNARDW